MITGLDNLRIVLVEPAGALNVGAIARVMKNMGLYQLVVVNTRCDPLGEDARLMAVHAADVLEQARQVETLPQALEGCQQAVATTARDRANHPLYAPEVGLRRLLPLNSSSPSLPPDAQASPLASALIFGPEDRGLSNEELAYAQCSIKIPTNPDYESLNLAQAVGICCYELSRLASGDIPRETIPKVSTPPAVSSALASLDDMERLYRHLEATLLEIGYIYPHTAASRMEKFRAMGHRAQLSPQDVTMLRGVLRQISWFIRLDRS
ncbi:MAG: RNA methyltransferase [Elainellaceae cyanobacterium]